MNIADTLDRVSRHFPDQPAILFEGRTLTYQHLRQDVDRLAHGLVARGIQTGDRVALFLPNMPAFVIAYLAAQKVGAVAVSLNVMLTGEEASYILEDSGARLVFTTAALAPRLEGVLPPENVVICEGDADGHPSLDSLGAASSGPFQPVELEPDAPAAILYTSGTTGRQKGATLCHRNVLFNALLVQHAVRFGPGDRLLLVLPLFHVFGQNFITVGGLSAGCTLVLHRRFEPKEALASIEQNRVTHMFAVPTIYINLLDAGVAPERLASVRYYFSAAAAMPLEVAQRWKATFGGTIHEGYGLTETSPFATYNHVWDTRPGSAGVALPLIEVRTVDEDDRVLGPGEWGEVCIKGPIIMLGYWNKPEEAAEAMRGGWFHTGDIGYLDADGYLYIVDRTKDMINAAGFKIWPREVEEVLYQHPAIFEAALVGVPDPVNGEAARAFIVLQPGASLTPEELESFCRSRLAAYKVPHQVEFVPALPKNPTGKILKRVLRDQATEARPTLGA